MIYYIIILLGARATLRVLVQLCAVSNVLASHLHPYSRLGRYKKNDTNIDTVPSCLKDYPKDFTVLSKRSKQFLL